MSPAAETAVEIRPFHIDVSDDQLAYLGRRIAATRWPHKELVPDRSQGVQLATIQELARYWATDHDLRQCEARLNALAQFTTEIDGVAIDAARARRDSGARRPTTCHAHPDASAYRGKFTGPYAHRVITGGIGHNLPQEAPRTFTDAVIDVGRL